VENAFLFTLFTRKRKKGDVINQDFMLLDKKEGGYEKMFLSSFQTNLLF